MGTMKLRMLASVVRSSHSQCGTELACISKAAGQGGQSQRWGFPHGLMSLCLCSMKATTSWFPPMEEKTEAWPIPLAPGGLTQESEYPALTL